MYLGSNTSLLFGANVVVKKVAEQGPFTHVLLNRGALTKKWDEHIRVSGLTLVVNGVDVRKWEVFGLHGQIAFFYVRDLQIDHFRCLDLGRLQYGIHVCTFEDILIEHVRIEGDKDGVHLGPRQAFHDPRRRLRDRRRRDRAQRARLLGRQPGAGLDRGRRDREHADLPNPKRQVGYFCRILAGAWIDWRPGMQVQQSDTVVSDGRLYRVQMDPDGRVYESRTRPTHKAGQMTLDGIRWGVVQDDVTYTAGVRNVVFRDIFLEKPRVAFSVHFDNDRYSRSFYPGASAPRQENILIENVRVLYDTAAETSCKSERR